jgi:hypothetical protein
VLRGGGDLESLLTEGAGGTAFALPQMQSLAGFSFRRWCPPVLGLEPHTPLPEYARARGELGTDEVSRRFLSAAGIRALCVDTGYPPGDVATPAETAHHAGARAFEIVRLEQVAENLAREGVTPEEFPDAYRHALGKRVEGEVEVVVGADGAKGSYVPVVGVKSIAAHRVGLELRGERPSFAEVEAAAKQWLARPQRLAHETLHRYFIWCGADLGLPIQFHVGYGDRDTGLNQCNPLLLTGLLRALEPTGVPVMLLHGYPYHREASYLAQVFPNVYADLGLVLRSVGSRAPAVLAEALEMVPLRKFLYSSDASGLPELYYLSSLVFRRALGEFLGAQINAGAMTPQDAERVTGLIASGNAARVYGIEVGAGDGAGRSAKS